MLGLGDADGDGDLDVVCANGGGGNELLINDGSASFSVVSLPGSTADTRFAAFGDVK